MAQVYKPSVQKTLFEFLKIKTKEKLPTATINQQFSITLPLEFI